MRIAQGFQFLALSSDAGLLGKAAREEFGAVDFTGGCRHRGDGGGQDLRMSFRPEEHRGYSSLGSHRPRGHGDGGGLWWPQPCRTEHREDEAESVAVVRAALDAGVNLIDTAEAYRTEKIVGQAIRELDRTKLVLSTKKRTGPNLTVSEVRQSLEASLRRLGTDYIDIYHLHGVVLEDYDYLAAEIVPELLKLRDEGKFRFLGITERWNADPGHRMLERALQDDVWDVMMVGFNILNQSARHRVFTKTIEKDIGVLVMFAVRRALSRPEEPGQDAGCADRGRADGSG